MLGATAHIMVSTFSLYNVDVHRPFYFDLDLFWTYQEAEKHLQHQFFNEKYHITPKCCPIFQFIWGLYGHNGQATWQIHYLPEFTTPASMLVGRVCVFDCLFVCLFALYKSQFSLDSNKNSHTNSSCEYLDRENISWPKVKRQGHSTSKRLTGPFTSMLNKNTHYLENYLS